MSEYTNVEHPFLHKLLEIKKKSEIDNFSNNLDI